MRFEEAVRINYRTRVGLIEKYEYLLSASTIVPVYFQKWELFAGQWSDAETDAVQEVMVILRRKGFDEQYATARGILHMGPRLLEGNRSTYGGQVEKLRRWVSDRAVYFSSEENARLNSNLNILADAPSHIRRRLAVDDQIVEAMKDFGRSLAYSCAMAGVTALGKAYEDNSPISIQIWPFTKNK